MKQIALLGMKVVFSTPYSLLSTPQSKDLHILLALITIN